MAPYIASPNKEGIDLRAPAFATLRRGSVLGWLRMTTLFTLDVVLLAIAWTIAETYSTPAQSAWLVKDNPLSLLLVVCISVSIIAARGLYKAGEKRRDYLGLVKAMTLAAVILLLTAYLYAPGEFVSRSHFISFWMLSIVFASAGRFVIDLATDTLRQKGAVRYPVFLISDQEYRSDAIALIERENRYNIVGIGDARALDRSKRDATFANIRNLGIVEAFVSWEAIKNRLFLCWYFQTAGITLHVLPIGIESLFQGSEFWMIGGSPSLTFPPPVITGIDFGIKRIFDFCCAALFIVFASPIYLLIALLIKLDSPGPIFYKQTRIGLHSKPFKVWKFRTMVTNADKLQRELEAMNESKDGILFKIKNDPRITRVGRILRQYSLDELPQIFNVLLGEMSFVGPRPLPTRDVDKFAEHHFIRHEVLPGITGMWQVSGRSDIDNFEDVVRLDLSYIENWSLWLDLRILLQTFNVVLHKTGAY
jgi:exopolysaccharide biosynthesis polyprenyl glycosylphosphotransferase